jgi:beta-mannosidase
MANQVKTLFGEMPDNLDDFALMSQISQAEAKKYFIERFRITRGRRNGIIWWNLVDGWPQISDAIVDYNYCKKLAYHYIKRSQQPVVLAFDEPETDTAMTLYGINDTTKDVTVSYRVRNITDGTVVAKASSTLTAEKSSRLLTVDIEKDEKKFYVMEWEYTDGECVTRGRNHFHTNLINIDYKAYKSAMEAADMLEIEGF